MPQQVIINLPDEDRFRDHLPEWVFSVALFYDVFIKDETTGDLIQVLDLAKEESYGICGH